MLVISQSENWSMRDPSRNVTFSSPQFHMLTNTMWANLSAKRQDQVNAGYERMAACLRPAPEMLGALAGLTETACGNAQWRRYAWIWGRNHGNRALTLRAFIAGGWSMPGVNSKPMPPLSGKWPS